jgi:lipopolysaccharide transport system permease protein
VGTAVVDALISFLLLVPLFVFYRRPVPMIALLLLPAVGVVAVALVAGLGLWAAALNSNYRDIRVIVPFALQLWMYCSPVVYPPEALPASWRIFVELNPATGVLSSVRACLLGGPVPWLPLAWSSLVALLLMVSGARYFQSREQTFADTL